MTFKDIAAKPVTQAHRSWTTIEVLLLAIKTSCDLNLVKIIIVI